MNESDKWRTEMWSVNKSMKTSNWKHENFFLHFFKPNMCFFCLKMLSKANMLILWQTYFYVAQRETRVRIRNTLKMDGGTLLFTVFCDMLEPKSQPYVNLSIYDVKLWVVLRLGFPSLILHAFWINEFSYIHLIYFLLFQRNLFWFFFRFADHFWGLVFYQYIEWNQNFSPECQLGKEKTEPFHSRPFWFHHFLTKFDMSSFSPN